MQTILTTCLDTRLIRHERIWQLSGQASAEVIDWVLDAIRALAVLIRAKTDQGGYRGPCEVEYDCPL